jgi:hypothetical protein
MAEEPIPVEAAGASVTPCVHGDHADEADHWPEDVPDEAAFTLRSLCRPTFIPPQEAASNDMMPVGVIYPGYRGLPGMVQNYRYDRFPPVANGRGTMHPVP